MPAPNCPPLAADTIIEVGERIVLIERRNEPRGLALPGGFVDRGESVEQAAIREAKEETNLDVLLTHLLGVYSAPDRDPRGQIVSTVFIATADQEPEAGDDAKATHLVDPRSAPALVFDHDAILKDYLRFKDNGSRPSPDEMLARLSG